MVDNSMLSIMTQTSVKTVGRTIFGDGGAYEEKTVFMRLSAIQIKSIER